MYGIFGYMACYCRNRRKEGSVQKSSNKFEVLRNRVMKRGEKRERETIKERKEILKEKKAKKGVEVQKREVEKKKGERKEKK